MIEITIPGQPVAQGRPRVTRFGTFDPQKSKDYKAFVGYCALDKKPPVPLDGPLTVRIDAYMGVPPSWSKKKREQAISGELKPTGRPDVSNIVKCVEDALTGIIWRDDAQIVCLSVLKRYSDNPRVEVVINEC